MDKFKTQIDIEIGKIRKKFNYYRSFKDKFAEIYLLYQYMTDDEKKILLQALKKDNLTTIKDLNQSILITIRERKKNG